MTRPLKITKRQQRELDRIAPAPPVAMPSSGIREWRHDHERGRSFPVLNGDDEALDVLARARAGKEMSGDHFLHEAIGADLAAFSTEVNALYWSYMFSLMRKLGGADIFTRAIEEATAPPPPSQAEVLAQTAQEKALSAVAVAHRLAGCREFQKASGQPSKSLIIRELLRQGFDRDAIVNAGYGRGSVSDAVQVVRSEYILRGEPLPPSLTILGPGRPRTGDVARTGTGRVADSNRAASRVVAVAAHVLAKPSLKARRKGVEQTVEAFDRQSFKGTYDEGSGNDSD